MTCRRVLLGLHYNINTMLKKKQKTALTDWEWTLVWSSMRYFMGRQTIASAMWPSDLINNYDKYLTQGQRDMIAKELKKHALPRRLYPDIKHVRSCFNDSSSIAFSLFWSL